MLRTHIVPNDGLAGVKLVVEHPPLDFADAALASKPLHEPEHKKGQDAVVSSKLKKPQSGREIKTIVSAVKTDAPLLNNTNASASDEEAVEREELTGVGADLSRRNTRDSAISVSSFRPPLNRTLSRVSLHAEGSLENLKEDWAEGEGGYEGNSLSSARRPANRNSSRHRHNRKSGGESDIDGEVEKTTRERNSPKNRRSGMEFDTKSTESVYKVEKGSPREKSRLHKEKSDSDMDDDVVDAAGRSGRPTARTTHERPHSAPVPPPSPFPSSIRSSPPPRPQSFPASLDPSHVVAIGDPASTMAPPSDDQGVSHHIPIPWSNPSLQQSSWQPLHDDDAWLSQHPFSTNPNDASPAAMSAIGSFNPLTGRWGPLRMGPGTTSRRSTTRQARCRRTGLLTALAVLVVLTIVSIIVFSIRARQPPPYDGSSGARGGVPMAAPPGPPLPVLNLLNDTSKHGPSGTYFGVSIDWVSLHRLFSDRFRLHMLTYMEKRTSMTQNHSIKILGAVPLYKMDITLLVRRSKLPR